MSRLPLPNWNNPPFCPPLDRNGFMQGNQNMPMNSFYQSGVPPRPMRMASPPNLPYNPHFMPRFVPNFHPPPFHPGVMQNGSPHRFPQQQQHRGVNKRNYRKPGGPQESPGRPFRCDACSRDFTSQEILNTHLQCHVQCTHSGCTFKASRKVLKLHFKEVHEGGTFQGVLDTPEKIDKWREERKRHYPTASNVTKKDKEGAKRRASGQVLQTKNYSYQKQRRQRPQRSNKFQRGKQNRNAIKHDPKSNANPKGVSTSTADVDPLSLLLGPQGSDESDTEIEQSDQERAPDNQSNSSSAVPVKGSTSALASLCSSYGNLSSDQDDVECMEDANKNRMHKEKEPGPPGKIRKRKSRTRPRRMKTNIGKICTNTGSGRPTLLQMLLAQEVRHERNVILQCLRFIVKKKCFGIGAETSGQ